MGWARGGRYESFEHALRLMVEEGTENAGEQELWLERCAKKVVVILTLNRGAIMSIIKDVGAHHPLQ